MAENACLPEHPGGLEVHMENLHFIIQVLLLPGKPYPCLHWYFVLPPSDWLIFMMAAFFIKGGAGQRSEIRFTCYSNNDNNSQCTPMIRSTCYSNNDTNRQWTPMIKVKWSAAKTPVTILLQLSFLYRSININFLM